MLLLSGVVAAAVVLLRGRIAALQGNSQASLAYLGIAPAVIFVAVICAFRGYFQGHGNMLPSGISQIVEQLFKLVFGLFLAARLLPRGTAFAVLGAVLGVTLSEFAAAALLALQFLAHKRGQKKRSVIPLKKLSQTGGWRMPSSTAVVYSSQIGTLTSTHSGHPQKTETPPSLLQNLNFEAGEDAGVIDLGLKSKVGTGGFAPLASGEKGVPSHSVESKTTPKKTAGETGVPSHSVESKTTQKAAGEAGIISPSIVSKNTQKAAGEAGITSPSIVSKTTPMLAETHPPLKTSEILKMLYKIAIPITLGSLIMPLTQVIDSVMVINVLAAGGMTRVAATALFGLVSGPINSLVNMPVAVTLAISVQLLPKISFLREKGGDADEAIANAVRLTLLLSLPAAAVFMFFPRQIVTALYSRGLSDWQLSVASSLLRIESLSVLYIGIIQVCTSVLQGADKPHRPALNLLCGALVKVLLTLVLLPFLGIRGAAAASVFCYGAIAVLGVFYARKVSAPRLPPVKTLLLPLAACVVMVVTAFLALALFSIIPPARALPPAIINLSAIVLGAAFYVLFLLVSKAVNPKEFLK